MVRFRFLFIRGFKLIQTVIQNKIIYNEMYKVKKQNEPNSGMKLTAKAHTMTTKPIIHNIRKKNKFLILHDIKHSQQNDNSIPHLIRNTPSTKKLKPQ